MPTLVQLQDEWYWGAEVVPPELDRLGRRLCTRYGRPLNAYGVRGDEFHLRGAHRSRRWIQWSAWCTNRTYTVSHVDDLAGDADWCAGLDFNPGSTERLIAMCQRLNTATRAGLIEEVSEWYGNVDGDQIVDGWNNVLNRSATSDSSHLWHVHITIKRRYANDAGVMNRLYSILTGDPMSLETDVTNIKRMLDAFTQGLPTWQTTGGSFISVVQVAARAEVAALTAVVQQLADTIAAGGGSVDTAAILAGVDAALTPIRDQLGELPNTAEVRDAVADLGEGGSKAVRDDAEPGP